MNEKRIIGYDLIRIIASLMVVAIHSNVYYLGFNDGSTRWFIIMELTALCVIAVPSFFMVSGAGNLVRENTISLKELYQKKIPRQFIPFALWSIIYLIARMVMCKIPVSITGFVSLIWEPAYYQFWFMYSLLGMYIAIPVFQFMIQRMDKKILQYTLVVWICSSVILPMLCRYIPGFKISEHFDLGFLEGYWGYFLLGGYLRKYPIKKAKMKGILLLFVGVLITSVSAIIEWLYTGPQNYYGYVFGAYLLPGAVMASAGTFLLLSNVSLSGKARDIVLHVSGLSMGIYYTHTMIINIIERLFTHLENSVGTAALKWLIVCVFAGLTTETIKRIGILRKYLLN